MQPSEARTPNLLALADGNVVPGMIAARITDSAAAAAGRMQASFALNAAPEGYWSGWLPSSVELRIGLDGGWNSLFIGVVDLVDFDLINGIVEIEGRDLTALLIDCPVEESFANRSSSEIAQSLATVVGLGAQVTATTDLIGRYWNSEWSRSSLGNYGKARSAWDLLVWLAAEEQFDVYVAGSNLYFGPPGAREVAITLDPTQCISLRVERSLRLAGNIVITVKSWNSRTKQSCTPSAVVAGAGGATWQKSFVRPNLQIADAEALALREANVLAQHERVVIASLPGEFLIAARGNLTLCNTGIDFDQSYIIDEVERVIDSENGFVEHVRARAPSFGRSAVIAGDG